MSTIETWEKRLERHTGHTGPSHIKGHEEAEAMMKLQEIKELRAALAKAEQERDALRADAKRMDWLDHNIYSRENVDLFGKPDQKYNMWVTFAPKGVQGSARAIIDAAMKGQP